MFFRYPILPRTLVLFSFLFFCNLSSSTAQTRQADSLELVAFYNSSCGTGCTLGWNFTQPMTSWLGVTMSGGRVTELRLIGAGLSGSVPNLNLTNLQSLDLNNNQLTGTIPDFANLPILDRLFLYNNQFTFEHLLTNYSAVVAKVSGSYQYAPQDSIGTAAFGSIPQGSNYTIDLVIDDTVTTNAYYWYKDGVLIDSTFGNNEYTISNFQSSDVGVYTAQVRNTIATNAGNTGQNLMLTSRPITLNMAFATANPTIPGLPTRVCANRADTIRFYRDPAFPFRSVGTIDSNNIDPPTTLNPAHQNAIITLNNTPNNEEFGFIPSRLPAGTNSVSISINYTTTQNTNPITLLGGSSANATIQIDSATPLDIDVPFNGVPFTGTPPTPHSYCRTDTAFFINPQPNPIGGGVLTSSINGYGITLPGTVYRYDPSRVSMNVDIDTVIYSYTNQFGCTSADTTFIKLSFGAVTNISNATTTYCFSNTSLTLTGAPAGGTFSGPGVSGNQFSFQSAGPGVHTISYTLNGCSGVSTKDFTIIAPPVARFTPPQAQYLTTDPPFQLFSQNDTAIGSYTFYGNPIINSFGLINPNTSPGPQTIYYSYDSLGCVGMDSASFVIAAPTPTSNPLVFVNNDPGAPNLIEACVGSSVSFTYDDFVAHPASVSLPDQTTGNRFLILTASSNTGPGTNSGVTGTLTFTIPTNAASGSVIFLDNNGVALDTTIYTLLIHNPTVDFSTQPTLICASNNSVTLNGFPAGGIFTGIGNSANSVGGTIFNPSSLPWSTNHADSVLARIEYAYTPTYSDGTPCPQALSVLDTLPVYDNRLNQVQFSTLTQQAAAVGNQFLSLDTSLSNMVTLTQPNIRCNSNPNGPIVPCFPHQFSGTFVDQNNNFLSVVAPGRSLVQLQYNNNGCIGSATGFIDILGALVINNLPDTLCANRSVIFGRDTNLVYVDTTFAVGVDTRRVIRNQLLSTTTRNPSHTSAINPIFSSPIGQEEFRFNDIGVSKVIIDMQYQSLTTVIDTAGNIDTTLIDIFTVTDSVSITGTNATTLRINNLDSTYCSNDFGDTLFASLGFLGTSNNIISLFYNNTTISLPDNFFSPQAVYDSLVPSGVGNLSLEVRYQVNYYGCVQNMTNRPTITITAPQSPSYLSNSPYCQGDPPDNLQRNGLTSGVSESFFGSPAIDPSTGVFSPRLAGIGNNIITYSLIDTHACVYSFSDTIIVNDGPDIELRLNGSSTLDVFCYNENSVAVNAAVTYFPNPYTSNNITIFGTAVTSTGNTTATFDPSIIYANGDTSTLIWVEMTDNSGCISSDTAYVNVIPPPTINIDSAFNFIPSAYGINNLDTSEHSYCRNTPSFIINEKPNHLLTGAGHPTNYIDGSGVIRSGNNFEYNPALVPSGVEVDIVVYYYTDDDGCTNTDTAIIKIDDIPTVSISGLPAGSTFCNNNDTIQLTGAPASSTGQGIFGGPGVDPTTGIFVPRLVGAPSTATLTYQYTASSGCSNTASEQVNVISAPTPLYSGYNGTREYCAGESNDTLVSNNDISGTYQFSGDLIIAGTDILTLSNLPDTNVILLSDLYYTYTSATGCTINDTITFQINPKPEIYFNDLDTSYCANGSRQSFRVSPNGGRLINTDTAFSILTDNRFIALDPTLTDTGYTSLTYAFMAPNGCSDTVTTSIYIQSVTLPSITGLDSFYCKTYDTITLTASLPGGYFLGSGVDSTSNGDWFFIPANAQNGPNSVQYIIPSIPAGPNQGLVCGADTTVTLVVQQLAAPRLISPTRISKFCSTDPASQFIYNASNSAVVHSFRADTSTSDSVVINNGGSYFFTPANASVGSNIVIHSVQDTTTGCRDSTINVFVVDRFIEAEIIGLDSSYCEENAIDTIFGIPTNSIITRDGTPIPPADSIFPNLLAFQKNGLGLPNNPLTVSIKDTVMCYYVNGGCSDTVIQIVDIHPVFNVNFTLDSSITNRVFCLGGDTIDLIPSRTGGLFSGNGVRTGTDFFIPDLAEAGIHPISFEYTDSITGCYTNFMDTFYVYGVPNLDFTVQGGCQFDTVDFVPNNAILGLDNLFQNNYIDSVTSVIWYVSDSVQIVGSGQRDSITPIRYRYNTPGAYLAQLIVSNREFCIDTQIVRLVISPKISSYPYEMDFENSNGDWFAESRDSSHRLLWEWGIDSNALVGQSDSNNHIWATQTNQAYQPDEDAWVYSPCFDLSSLNRPMISLDFWSDVRPSDGALLEYQGANGRWFPLGAVNRGIDWYNSGAVYARPGDQVLPGSATSMGWIGQQQSTWKNGRCKLDGIAYNNSTRFRIAFASLPNPLSGSLDGFAFDNVIIRNRTRNVLLESMVHNEANDMEYINNKTYQLVYDTSVSKDVTLLQYHIERANNSTNNTNTTEDPIYLQNDSLGVVNIGSTRSFEYGNSPAGRAYIDGADSSYITEDLTEVDFEQDMLETPKFGISIDTFLHVNNNFSIIAQITALEPLDSADYRVYTIVSQDSLYYTYDSSNVYLSPVHAVARKNNEIILTGFYRNTFQQPWYAGQSTTVFFDWNYTGSTIINYQANHFHAVVFIQNINTREIYQVASTRDASGYWVGIEPIQAKEELNELQNLKLFPNPAHDYFNLQFDQVLEHDYQWKLVNMQGIEVQQGTLPTGTDQMTIDGLNYPAGSYILLLYNKSVFVQRQVILGRP
ncbi:MAG: T9SS type A sorting domain-containing protein [Aureispira sp.]